MISLTNNHEQNNNLLSRFAGQFAGPLLLQNPCAGKFAEPFAEAGWQENNKKFNVDIVFVSVGIWASQVGSQADDSSFLLVLN